MDETVRENLSKYVGKAAFFIAWVVILLATRLPGISGVTSPIFILFPKFPDAPAALIGFILGSCAYAALTPLFWIQFTNLLPKLEMTWSFAIRFAALVLSILSYWLTIVFLFHSREALEEFRYPIFSEGILCFPMLVYAAAFALLYWFRSRANRQSRI
jgi:hypothetical protein